MFNDNTMQMAYQLGAYKAIADMMRDSIRELNSDSEFTREWAQRRLVSLADQLEETEEKFKKEVDTAAA